MTKTLQRNKIKTIRIKTDVKLSDPRPMAIAVMLKNSQSADFDIAKTEWMLKGVVYEDAEGFNNICDLCGNTSLKYNFIIYNPNTDSELNVGSHCIIRFGVVKGNVDAETGGMMLNNFLKVQRYYDVVRSGIKGLMSECVYAKDYKDFLESMSKILEYKNLTEPTLDDLGEICFGDKWEEHKQYLFKCERLERLWYQPSSIKMIKTKGVKFKVIKEGDTYWGKKRGSVYMPGQARSEGYKTDKISD